MKNLNSLLNKLLIYKEIIRPILLYAAPNWSNTKSNLNSIEKVPNEVIKMITIELYESNEKIREKLWLKFLKKEIFENAERFYKVQIRQYSFLNDVADLNKRSAHFKIKHKFPRHVILIYML